MQAQEIEEYDEIIDDDIIEEVLPSTEYTTPFEQIMNLCFSESRRFFTFLIIFQDILHDFFNKSNVNYSYI